MKSKSVCEILIRHCGEKNNVVNVLLNINQFKMTSFSDIAPYSLVGDGEHCKGASVPSP
jgi:hypothetical protein